MAESPAERSFRIDLEPVGRRVELAAGQTLLDAARAAGIEMVAVCGGEGWCHTCLVRPMAGRVAAATATEEDALGPELLRAGFRLACQALPLSDVKVEIPPDSLATQQRLQLEGEAAEHAVAPLVEGIDITVAPATLEDLRADATRLQDAVEALDGTRPAFGHAVLRGLSAQLRAQGWSARLGVRRERRTAAAVSAAGAAGAMLGGEVVAVAPSGAALFGLAVDLGTTKIAAYLVELATGRTLARAGAVNPQVAYGEDVVSRISYAIEHADGRETLRTRVVDTLNDLVSELCAEAGRADPAAAAARERIVDAVIVGNTAMHHLFAGLPVDQLGRAPYIPAVSEPLDIPARDLGLEVAAGAYVHLPANIAGYVGADHVAMALAAGVWETQRTVIAVDIGTNTEVTLACGGRIWSCSCASGPAFEGAHIRDGMRAAPGAIERVQLAVNGRPRLKVIGDAPPVGICGSGIMDAISELLRIGAIDRKGVFRTGHPRVGGEGGTAHYLLAGEEATGHGRAIVVTRKDINEIQLAKAAIRVGVEVLLHEAGIAAGQIDEFIVAGAFGAYLDLASTVRTGMFPELPLVRFRQVGNAAGAGARQLLVSAERRAFAGRRARDVAYVELTIHPEFARQYMRRLYF
jgi:uncharacterized 2Fe-2S/4Fe-4S cluster protein (DUF4445 family)